MGTNRLGPLPRTKRWSHLVGAFVAGAGPAQVAQEALEAASSRLAGAADDVGLVETLRLLMVLPIAANSDDFAGALRGVGVDVADGPGFCDVLAAVSERLDASTPGARGRSDVGEMAQTALAEPFAEVVGRSLKSLVDPDPEDVRQAFARQRTAANLGTMAAGFFGKFAAKCLDYFLSRELPRHVGPGRRLPSLADYAAFTRDLAVHCRETAKIVETFAGEWHSREAFRNAGEIDAGRAKAFVYGALAKVTAELKRGAR